MVTAIPYNMKSTVTNIPPTLSRISGGATSFFRSASAAGAGGARRALATLGNNNAQLNMNMAHSLLAKSQEGFMKRWDFNPVKEVPLASGRYLWTPIGGGRDKKISSTPRKGEEQGPILACLPSAVISRVPDLHKVSQDSLDNDNTVLNSNNGFVANSTSKSMSKLNAKSFSKYVTKSVPTSYFKQGSSNNEDETVNNVRKQVLCPISEKLQVSKKIVSSKSQKSITNFFRAQKRPSSYHSDEGKSNSSMPTKKLRTLL